MANKYQVFGQARVRINGSEIDHAGKVKFNMGGKKRDAVEADNKAGFFTSQAMEATCEFEALVTPALSIQEINAWEDVTLTLELDTGQVYVINHARVTDPADVSDGKASVKTAGPPAEEITS